jgi:uncharacterized protein YbjQ (UPF0145 family)
VITEFSGNEIYCLAQKEYLPGKFIIGNALYPQGVFQRLGKGSRATTPEYPDATALITNARMTAHQRLLQQAEEGSGIIGVTHHIRYHDHYIEFLATGSSIQYIDSAIPFFSAAADGQAFYILLDMGYRPLAYIAGNVAYPREFAQGLLRSLKVLTQGEVKEFSAILQQSRQLVIERMLAEAQKNHAKAIIGIKTLLFPFGHISEMRMSGTAVTHDLFPPDKIMTSNLNASDLWSLGKIGYQPLQLLISTAVYSLGFAGSIHGYTKSFSRYEENSLTQQMRDARLHVLSNLEEQAKALGAEKVIGVKIHLNALGNGLTEFLAIGTAIQKCATIKISTTALPVQAIIPEENNFYNANPAYTHDSALKPLFRIGLIFLIIVGLILLKIKS